MAYVSFNQMQNPIYLNGPLPLNCSMLVGLGGIDSISSITDYYKIVKLEPNTIIEGIRILTDVLTGPAPIIKCGFRTNAVDGLGNWIFGTELLNAIAIPVTGGSYYAAKNLPNADSVDIGINFSLLPPKLSVSIVIYVVYRNQKDPLYGTYSVSLPEQPNIIK